MNLIIKGKDKGIKFIQNRVNESSICVEKIVEEIIENVRVSGDEALKLYTEKYDGLKLEILKVSENEIDLAFENIDCEIKNALIIAKNNIERYHKKQLKEGYYLEDEDKRVGQKIVAIEKVGVYIPGGSASYPSTVLMNVVPAKLAGVDEIVMVTPANKEGKIKDSVLAAAKIVGVNKIYKIGGAQAIAALAYGTDSVPAVDKIVGPGNIYVATAKQKLSSKVGIDMIAGPSEIVIIADDSSKANFIASDLISQAEHDKMAAAIMITDSEKLAIEVNEAIEKEISSSPRKEIISKSMSDYGAIIIVDNVFEAVELANEIAPEHLEIMTKNCDELCKHIKNAGAIFLGEYTPEAVGDYIAGSNHTLPTNGTSRFSSALSIDDFIKKISVVYYSENALRKSRKNIVVLAENEGLYAHKRSVEIRFEED